MGDHGICRFVGSVASCIKDVSEICVLKIFRFAGFIVLMIIDK